MGRPATAAPTATCSAVPTVPEIALFDRPKLLVAIGLVTDCTDFRIVAGFTTPHKTGIEDHVVRWTPGHVTATEAFSTEIDFAGAWQVRLDSGVAGVDGTTRVRFPKTRLLIDFRRRSALTVSRSGATATFSGTLTVYRGTAGYLPDEDNGMRLQLQAAGGEWSDVTTVRSGIGGRVEVTVPVTGVHRYRWAARYVGGLWLAVSDPVRI